MVLAGAVAIEFETLYFHRRKSLVIENALMRFGIAPSVVVTLLLAVSLVSAQDASDTATSQYETLKHSILVLKFVARPMASRSLRPTASSGHRGTGDHGSVE